MKTEDSDSPLNDKDTVFELKITNGQSLLFENPEFRIVIDYNGKKTSLNVTDFMTVRDVGSWLCL